MKLTSIIKISAPALGVVLLAAGFVVAQTPLACACGEIYPGKAAYHWDEMSMFERARFKVTGDLPFDKSGDRL